MKKILSLLLLIGFASCTSETADSFETRISGHYKVVSFVADGSVDLNNDGVQSNDLYKR